MNIKTGFVKAKLINIYDATTFCSSAYASANGGDLMK